MLFRSLGGERLNALPDSFERQQQTFGESGGRKLVLRPKQEQLLQLLRERGSLSPRELWDALGVSKQGAMDLLKPLIEAGLIKREGTLKTGRHVRT